MEMDMVSIARMIRAMNWRVLDQSARVRRQSHAARNGDPEARNADLRNSLEAPTNAALPEERSPVTAEQAATQSEASLSTQLAWAAEARRFRDLFSLAPVAYLVTDRAGIIRRGNHAAASLLNINDRFLPGKPLFTFVELNERRQLRQGICALQSGRYRGQWKVTLTPRGRPPQTVIFRACQDRGPARSTLELRWVILEGDESSEGPLPTEASGPGIKRAAAASRSPAEPSLEHPSLRTLVDTLRAVVWQADPRTGRLRFVSRYVEDLLGFPHEQWLDVPDFWFERSLPDDRSIVVSTRTEVLRTGRPAEIDYRMRHADGRVIWVRETVSAAFDSMGGPIACAGLVVGIGRRKKLERRLYSARRELAIKLTDLTYLMDLVGRVSAADCLADLSEAALSAFTSLLGTDHGVLLLQSCSSADLEIAATLGLAEADAAGILSACRDPKGSGLAEALEQPIVMAEVASDGSGPLQDSADRLGFGACYSTPLFHTDGRAFGLLVALFAESSPPPPNLLRLVELFARQVEPMFAMLRLVEQTRLQADQKDIAFSILAHELRNPAAAILYTVQLLRTSEESIQEEGLQSLEQQIHHLVQLVNDLSDISRIMQGKIRLQIERVDLREIVALAVRNRRESIDRHGHQLVLSMPELALEIDADPTRLVEVFGNLLENAAKYTPGPDGRIEIEVAGDDADVRVHIRDNGIGISPDNLPGLFTLFSQVDTRSPHAEGGLGIGLSLARHLVELHGGAITARSSGLGRGCEFIVRLPREPGDNGEPRGHAAVAIAPAPPRGARRRILVVDDHEMSARLLARILKHEGHMVDVACDGATALERVQSFSPDVVLLDLDLSGLSGFEVAHRLRARPDGGAMTLISVTGEPASEARSHELAAGFDHHLVKPVNLDELEALLKQPAHRPTNGQSQRAGTSNQASPTSN